MLLALALAAVLSAPPESPGPRAHHWLVYDEGRSAVVLCGGSTPVGDSFTFYDEMWSFDGAAWTRAGTLGRPLSGVRVAWHPDAGALLAFGGFTSANRSIGDLRELVEGEWVTLDPAADKSATEAGFVFDAQRARFVLFGGAFARGNRGTTWEWDGAQWKTFAPPAPPARSSHGMVYDAKRGRTVLFGGSSGGPAPLGDTWEWDGVAWTQVHAPGPSARLAPAMAYDSRRNRTLLFGGGGPGGSLGDTWSYDGTSWERLDVPGPSPRISPAMAYDASRDRMVLFGGRASWPNDLADTWTFDGKAWAQVALVKPVTRR